MTLSYETIFSRARGKIDDPKELYLDPNDLLEIYTERLHSVAGNVRIRRMFSTFVLDDEIQTMTFELNHPVDEQSDQDFIIEIFVLGMVIEWLKPLVDSLALNSFALGGKEEKVLLNNRKYMEARLDNLRLELHKRIRDYGAIYNPYVLGE